MNNFFNQQMYRPFQPFQNNGIIWVQGIEGAKSYPLNANSNAVLMDSETDGVFYIKTCDSIGMPSLRIFNFSEVSEKKSDMSEYVTKDEFTRALEELKGVLNEQLISKPESNKTAKS